MVRRQNTGINLHEGEKVGGWDSSITREDFEKMFAQQQASMAVLERAMEDLKNLPTTYEADEDFEDEEEPVVLVQKKTAKSSVKAEVDSTRSTIVPSAFSSSPAKTTSQGDMRFDSFSPRKQERVQMQSVPVKDVAQFAWVKPGVQVEHRKFGVGRVIQMDRDLAVIKFSGGTKNMEFPGAFERGILGKPGEIT